MWAGPSPNPSLYKITKSIIETAKMQNFPRRLNFKLKPYVEQKGNQLLKVFITHIWGKKEWMAFRDQRTLIWSFYTGDCGRLEKWKVYPHRVLARHEPRHFIFPVVKSREKGREGGKWGVSEAVAECRQLEHFTGRDSGTCGSQNSLTALIFFAKR